MASVYGLLAKEAIVLLDKFSAGRQCLDDFIEEASKDLQIRDTLQKKFILDVVSGCIEHKKLLDIVVNVFYGQHGNCLSRGDHSQYDIICYLTTFALDDLGLQRFSNIITSLDVKNMHRFLTFFFTNLTTWIQEEWNTIYDAAFVETRWIQPLQRWRPELDILMAQLVVKKSHENQVTKSPMKTTKPQHYIAKPKPPPLSVPEPLPQQEPAKPVPKSTYMAPKAMQMMEEIKQKNHQKMEELLYEANMKQFRCVNPHKSEHAKRVMSQIKEDLDSKLKFNSFQSSEPPSTNKTTSCPPKLNSAAIMRLGALHDRQVEEQLQRMERLVEGAHEPSPFLQWQKEMRDQDLQKELTKIEHRRLEGRISYEEAAMARTRLMERNQKTAQLKKEETAQLMRNYAEKRLQEEKEMRELMQQVAEGHNNSKTAKKKLLKFKQSIVKEVVEQRREILGQALEEAQAELSRKFKVICEIRAMQSLPHFKGSSFDDTESAGHWLQGEMSLLELKERLAFLREAQQTEQHEKREHILEEKKNKKQLLLERLDAINLHSRVLAQAAASRKEEKTARLSFQQAMIQNDTVWALQKKLEEKQRERQRLKQTKSMTPKTSERAAAHTGTRAKKSLTEKRKEELEQSLEGHLQEDAPGVVPQTKTLKT